MGRKSQELEICSLILEELLDVKEKQGVTFNKLFKKVKKKRGKFSFDTLIKYLNQMEADGRIIRVTDVNSNRKIKPTLLFKNIEVIHIREEKSNFKNILMDANTKFYRFPKNRLTTSDLFPQFNELLMNFLKNKMNLDIEYLEPSRVLNWPILLKNFDLFLVENPEIEGEVKNFNDLILLLYLNLLELILGTKTMDIGELNFDLFFHIDFYELFTSIILSLIDKIQKEGLLIDSLFLNEVRTPKKPHLTREDILNLLLNQLHGDFKEEVKTRIQARWFDEFSERYKKEVKM